MGVIRPLSVLKLFKWAEVLVRGKYKAYVESIGDHCADRIAIGKREVSIVLKVHGPVGPSRG